MVNERAEMKQAVFSAGGIVLGKMEVPNKAAVIELMKKQEALLQAQFGPQVKLELKGGE